MGMGTNDNGTMLPSNYIILNLAILISESLETRRVPGDAVSKWSGIELFFFSFSLSICCEVIRLILRTLGYQVIFVEFRV